MFGYFLLGKPLAVIFQLAASFVALLGCIRFFRQQNAMALGKVYAGGWEMVAIAIFSFLVSARPITDVLDC